VPVRAAKHFFWTPEAARYVQWWARFAGMDDIEIANNLIVETPCCTQRVRPRTAG